MDALSHVVVSPHAPNGPADYEDPVVTALGYTAERSAITECVSLRACAHDWTVETIFLFGREQVVFGGRPRDPHW